MTNDPSVTITPNAGPSTEDLARAIAAIDHTLSEVLVLLYHVVQTNQGLMERMQREATRSAAPSLAGAASRLEKGQA
jgi:hypothetical protein